MWGPGKWAEFCLHTIPDVPQLGTDLAVIQPDRHLSLSNYVGVCGSAGITAYFAILHASNIFVGERLLVSGAAGGVGSVVGQLAKLHFNCKTIGIAGSAEKCQWLTKDLGFDSALNYRDETFHPSLADECRGDIDIYFDNVGGDILNTVMSHLSYSARIMLCGMMTQYNDRRPARNFANLWELVARSARIQGYNWYRYKSDWLKAQAHLAAMVRRGHLKFREDIVDGLENVSHAFERMFVNGSNGRLIARLDLD